MNAGGCSDGQGRSCTERSGQRPALHAHRRLRDFPVSVRPRPADTAQQRSEFLPDGVIVPADLLPSVRAHVEAVAHAAKHLNDLREVSSGPVKSSRRPPRLVALAAAAGGLVHDHRRLPVAGFAVLPPLLFARSKATPLLVWSSLVCIGFGLVHLRGLLQVRPQL